MRDNPNKRYTRQYTGDISYDDFAQSVRGLNHEAYLLDGLTSEISDFEHSIYLQEYSSIFNITSEAFDDDLLYVNGRCVCSKDKLDVRNLASGSKLFLIIKMLIEKGCFKRDTLIVLDEPENHLHPEWINKLAEALVLINRDIKAKIIITTHSPNFMLALETYMRKYKLNDTTNFYKSYKKEDGYLTNFKCVNESIDEIYTSFVNPYTEVFKLREKLMNDSIED